MEREGEQTCHERRGPGGQLDLKLPPLPGHEPHRPCHLPHRTSLSQRITQLRQFAPHVGC
jgi:hypothetical protein